MAKKASSFPPYVLAFAATALLAGGWIMSPFPLLIFFGFAPLLTFSETADKGILEKMEWVLFALIASLALLAFVQHGSLVSAVVMGMVWTLAFVAHAWVRQVLGIRTGKITLILFWLALEYVCLKLSPENAIFLGDALEGIGDWTRWTAYTGYLGTGAWILIVNWTVYKAFLDQPWTGSGRAGLSWGWLFVGLAMLAGPALFSQSLPDSPVTREVMIKLYEGQPIPIAIGKGADAYLARGEWVVRTAAWISLLILLFTAVKSQTRKK